jgi:hypothetical protein
VRTIIVATILMSATAWSVDAQAASDKYAITPAEHAACDADATNLCADHATDEDQVIDCMKASRPQLSASCRRTLDDGLQRRRLPL